MATILIVDDELSNLEIMAAILTRQGHSILAASDAGEALRHCHNHCGNIDLVLTDVVLRGETGVELADEIGRYRPGVPFLFVSGYSKDALAEVFERGGRGNHPFLAKPFTVARLVSEVNSVLENACARQVGAA